MVYRNAGVFARFSKISILNRISHTKQGKEKEGSIKWKERRGVRARRAAEVRDAPVCGRARGSGVRSIQL